METNGNYQLFPSSSSSVDTMTIDTIIYNLNNNVHPSRNNSFYGESINPYDVIFHKWFWHNSHLVNFNVIQQYINHNNIQLNVQYPPI